MNENRIYKALQVLDQENKGYYTKEELERFMTTEGINVSIIYSFKFFIN